MKFKQLKNELEKAKNNWQSKQAKQGSLQERLGRWRDWFLLSSLSLLGACSTFDSFRPNASFTEEIAGITTGVQAASRELAMLSWVGGLATIAGIAALVVTRGALGGRAVIIGVCLVVLNFAIANYLSWILLPMLVGTGCISLAWSYVTIKQMILKKQEYKK